MQSGILKYDCLLFHELLENVYFKCQYQTEKMFANQHENSTVYIFHFLQTRQIKHTCKHAQCHLACLDKSVVGL